MQELIQINTQDINGELIQTVDARRLHQYLEIGKRFNTWIKDRIRIYEFQEGEDYVIVENLRFPKLGSSKSRQQTLIDYHLTLDMAKELSMVERNEKGRQARKYFIACEKKLTTQMNSAPLVSQKLNAKTALAESCARILNMSDTSKIRMLGKIGEEEGVSTNFLPHYSDERLTKALSDLLKEHDSHLSARAANIILIEMEHLEELERRSSKGQTKVFKSITGCGLEFGKNETSVQSPNQTQPRYYVDVFPELLNRINSWLGREVA